VASCCDAADLQRNGLGEPEDVTRMVDLSEAHSFGWMRYWGKASPSEPGDWHPLVFHSLDVAAVADRLLIVRPRLRRHLARLLRIEEDLLCRLIVVLACWHDLGKFAEGFQYKRSDLWEALQRTEPRREWQSDKHHDQISVELWAEWAAGATPFPLQLRPLVIAAFGHHGKPPFEPSGLVHERLPMSDASKQAALGFAKWCWDRFMGSSWPPDRSLVADGVNLASWWTAGLLVLADWIGSNTRWFPYATEAQRQFDLDRYFTEVAHPRADRALAEAGLRACKPAAARSFADLFPSLAGFAQRPAQLLAGQIRLGDGPQLFVLEDATGSGKTEAALTLVHRLMAADAGDGLFFGLPTQATADQMYERVDRFGERLFAPGERPSIVLAHGSRDSNERFSQRLSQVSDDGLPREAESASLGLTDWLGHSVKRALLADLGIGTLDQAQLAALRVKHQSLRLLGLFGKVLVVDEVHAYDPYMTTVLKNLIEAHALAGGSVILLSATLPASTLTELVAAFRQGAKEPLKSELPRKIGQGRSDAESPSSLPPAREYPLLTHWHPGLSEPRAFAIGRPDLEPSRHVRIDYVCERDAVRDRIRQAVGAGHCVCWIRNSIRDALDAYEWLLPDIGPERLDLFHARFALVDRLAIQARVLSAFDKHSTSGQRRGKVVIATQVVEQSLDLDFDLLISDLAPIELLLQRQGRLRRHRRDGSGNPVDGPDERGEIVFVVHGPDRHGIPDKGWYQRFSSSAARVYPEHGKLWQSAQVLGDTLMLPQDFRRTVDAVYESKVPVPPCFDEQDAKAVGEREVAPTTHAQASVCIWRRGYRRLGHEWDDDEKITTRLGDSLEAVLAVVEDGQLRPYAMEPVGDEAQRWALSAIRVPSAWRITTRSTHPDPGVQGLIDRLRNERRQLRFRLVLVLMQGDVELRDETTGVLRMTYGKEFGLRMTGRTKPRDCGER
jgi:CRISPR-associated endonuclease/helicase Cas3